MTIHPARDKDHTYALESHSIASLPELRHTGVSARDRHVDWFCVWLFGIGKTIDKSAE